MAALRRTTRQQQQQQASNSVSSNKSSEPPQPQRRRRRKRALPAENVNSRGRGRNAEEVEVIDLCDSSSSEEDDGGGESESVKGPKKSPAEEEKVDEYDDDEEEEEEGPGFRAFIDFESEDSLANLTVKSFFRDCFMQPKILCHRRFRPIRDFIEKATGVSFQLPENSPFKIDHEDETFCVDKGDKWLQVLKERLNTASSNSSHRRGRSQGCAASEEQEKEDISNNNDDESDDDDEEEDDPRPYYWATITPVQRKSDLGLVIFRWTPLPMSLPYLGIYLHFCEMKYVPPKPPPPPPPLKAQRNIRNVKLTRASLKRQVEAGIQVSPVENLEETETDKNKQVEEETDSVEKEGDNGVDEYIKDFVRVFKLTRNIDVEERLHGDIEARTRRRLENKEEPKYSQELRDLLRQNRLLTNRITLVSRKPEKLGLNSGKVSDSDSDESASSSSVSSVSSKESVCSEYKARIRGPRLEPKKRKVVAANQSQSRTIPAKTTTAPLASSSKKPNKTIVTNGLIKINGTIKRSCSRGSSTNRSSEVVSTSSSSTSSPTSPSNRVNKKSHRKVIACEVCLPPKVFSTWKCLYRHLSNVHGRKRRELATCECGTSIRTERLAFHKRYCKKAIIMAAGMKRTR